MRFGMEALERFHLRGASSCRHGAKLGEVVRIPAAMAPSEGAQFATLGESGVFPGRCAPTSMEEIDE